LVLNCELVSQNRAGKAALRADAELIERHVPGGFIDPSFKILGPLQLNGGGTETMTPLPGSPAIDAIPLNNGECEVGPALDQRSFERPFGPGCDIGAVEATPPPVLTVPDDFSVSYDERTSVTWSASATNWTGAGIADHDSERQD
jgi:hypothetical protein